MIAFADNAADAFELFASSILPGFAPRPIVPSWEWVCKNGRTPDGQPFDGETMPWAKGVCEAWDHAGVREVVLMWGTRLGKTMLSLQLVAKSMATNPLPGLFGTANETLAKRTTRNKLYKVLAAIRETRAQLLPERLRSIHEIRLTDCTWPVIWSGSNTMLADWGACYGWANEISKWDEKKSGDGVAKAGDTLAQFEERFKEFQHSRKVLYECSPALKGRCKIERKYLASDQRRYHVPCRHCKHFQVLKMGNGDPSGGGIVFDKLPDGKLDADLAGQTARYVCEKCGKEIRDEHRAKMMRCGTWAPKGCTVDKRGRVCGQPERTCEVAGFHLSSLYSLQMRWGDIAKKFVECLRNPALLQVFKNDWLGETWEPHRVKNEPEDVADRLRSDIEPGIIPAWGTWLFAAGDVQAEYFKWAHVVAGPGERTAIINRGACDTWEEFYDQCVNVAVPHADGGPALMPCLTLIDSAHKTKEVYDHCRAWSRPDRLVIPCKGANNDLNGEPYQKILIGDGTKRGSKLQRRLALMFAGMIRIRVNVNFYEPIIDRQLHTTKPEDADRLELPDELADDDEFMRELCNGVQSDEPSKMDPGRFIWIPRWGSEANDYRDIYKYARCGMDVKFRGNWRVAERRQSSNKAAPTPQQPATAASQATEQETGRRRGGRTRQRMRRERMRRR